MYSILFERQNSDIDIRFTDQLLPTITIITLTPLLHAYAVHAASKYVCIYIKEEKETIACRKVNNSIYFNIIRLLLFAKFYSEICWHSLKSVRRMAQSMIIIDIDDNRVRKFGLKKFELNNFFYRHLNSLIPLSHKIQLGIFYVVIIS